MNMKKRTIILAVAALLASGMASAQSQSFKLGKWTEIQNAILKELNRSYVDSLPVDRIERAGIDAMLGDLDPYTVYIPEEENGERDHQRTLRRSTCSEVRPALRRRDP